MSEKTAMFSQIGKKALIVTGKNSAKLSGALDDVKYALEKNNIEYVIFDKVMSNPTVECVYDGAETAMEEEVDFVIAIGGGSPMDSAKAIALLAVSDIERKNLFDGNIGNKALPMIHIPTTAGTGSEVTPYAILTNHENRQKRVLRHHAFSRHTHCLTQNTQKISDLPLRSIPQ